MALRLYLNHNVPRAVAEGLALRDVDVLTAYADGSHESLDPSLLDRATELGRVLVSMDDDLLKEAARRQEAGIDFAGVLYGHQLSCSVGAFVQDLELLAKACEPEELRGRVEYLPL